MDILRDLCHPRIQVAIHSLACNMVDRGNHKSKPYIPRPDPNLSLVTKSGAS